MKKTYLLIVFTILVVFTNQLLYSQNSLSLIRIHNVSDVAAMNNISSPFIGSLVYVIENSTMYQYDGANWIAVGGGDNAWSLTGNSGTVSSQNYIGTSDLSDLSFRTNDNTRMALRANNPHLLFNASSSNNSSLIGIRRDDNLDYAARMRITGSTNNYGFEQSYDGASIDLFSENVSSSFAENTSDIHLIAGYSSGSTYNGSIEFFTGGENRMSINEGGDINIRNDLLIEGVSSNDQAFNAGSSSTIDFSQANMAYTTASPGNFTLNNLKDGATYTLAVQGGTAGTSNFSSSGFTFRSNTNGQTIANRHTLYTFLVMGNVVYFTMSTGI